MNQFLIVIGIMVAGAALVYFLILRPKWAHIAAVKQKGCPQGTIPTTAQDVCLPGAFVPDSQIDRSDGGFVITTKLVSDPATRRRIADTVVLGLSRMVAAVRHHKPDWPNALNTGSYQIIMIPKTATTEQGFPALIVSGFKSAGTVINVFADLVDRGEPIMILPEPDSWLDENYWPYLEASAYHEGEHIMEWKNDKAMFLSKIGAGDIHPHWPPVDAPVGFVSAEPVAQECTVRLGSSASQKFELRKM